MRFSKSVSSIPFANCISASLVQIVSACIPVLINSSAVPTARLQEWLNNLVPQVVKTLTPSYAFLRCRVEVGRADILFEGADQMQ